MGYKYHGLQLLRSGHPHWRRMSALRKAYIRLHWGCPDLTRILFRSCFVSGGNVTAVMGSPDDNTPFPAAGGGEVAETSGRSRSGGTRGAATWSAGAAAVGRTAVEATGSCYGLQLLQGYMVQDTCRSIPRPAGMNSGLQLCRNEFRPAFRDSLVYWTINPGVRREN